MIFPQKLTIIPTGEKVDCFIQVTLD